MMEQMTAQKSKETYETNMTNNIDTERDEGYGTRLNSQ